ncbi:MAG: hypothetical protein EBU08_17540 [Micrococcales bacterium]|nr:hypothetical protein [Micrococcales bacterium]
MAYGVYGQGLQLNDGNPNTPTILTQPTPLALGAIAAWPAATTYTANQLGARIWTANPSAAVTFNYPTGAALDAYFPNAQNNSSFELAIINLNGTNAITVNTVPTGVTYIGGATTIPLSSQGILRFRRTGTATWVVYRIA